jgi:ADP-glucose pyrophosphorylase
LGEGAHVERGVHIERSVVFSGVYVRQSTRDAIVTRRATYPANGTGSSV